MIAQIIVTASEAICFALLIALSALVFLYVVVQWTIDLAKKVWSCIKSLFESEEDDE